MFEPEPRFPAAGEFGSRPAGARSAGVFGGSGCAFFWFLFFAQAKKRNPPAARKPLVAVKASPQAIQPGRKRTLVSAVRFWFATRTLEHGQPERTLRPRVCDVDQVPCSPFRPARD